MSGFNNDESFLNLMGWNNPNARSSFSNPNAGSSSTQIPLFNPLGLLVEELLQQHQQFLLWQRNQQMLNTNFLKLQFEQQSQPLSQPPSQSSHTQIDTNDVSEAPTSPQNPTMSW
jgi:hypothetical protein